MVCCRRQLHYSWKLILILQPLCALSVNKCLGSNRWKSNDLTLRNFLLNSFVCKCLLSTQLLLVVGDSTIQLKEVDTY